MDKENLGRLRKALAERDEVLTAFRRDTEARVLLAACDGDVAEAMSWLKRLLSPSEVWRQRQELGVSLAEAGREIEVEGERMPLGDYLAQIIDDDEARGVIAKLRGEGDLGLGDC